MALSGDARVSHQVEAADFRVEHVPPPTPIAARSARRRTTSAPSGARARRQAIDARGRQQVAAVLMEPNAGTNGIVAPDGYWPRLREETLRRGVLLIADEVMSGFGRCGEWFAVAAARRGRPARPDDAGQGPDARPRALGAVVLSREVAERLEHQPAGRRASLLRPPAGLRAGPSRPSRPTRTSGPGGTLARCSARAMVPALRPMQARCP